VEAFTAREVAARSDVLFLCLPPSVEVEAVVLGDGGTADALPVGAILVDSTTADPVSTRRIGAELARRSCAMATRTNIGRLSTPAR
jgi:3-hydroxyisobutyrate dehydrogenase-like beta-hydroxyacid dehydrogenase